MLIYYVWLVPRYNELFSCVCAGVNGKSLNYILTRISPDSDCAAVQAHSSYIYGMGRTQTTQSGLEVTRPP